MRIINSILIRTLFIIQQNFIRTKYFDRESDLLQYSQSLWIIQLESMAMKLFLQYYVTYLTSSLFSILVEDLKS